MPNRTILKIKEWGISKIRLLEQEALRMISWANWTLVMVYHRNSCFPCLVLICLTWISDQKLMPIACSGSLKGIRNRSGGSLRLYSTTWTRSMFLLSTSAFSSKKIKNSYSKSTMRMIWINYIICRNNNWSVVSILHFTISSRSHIRPTRSSCRTQWYRTWMARLRFKQ